MHLKISSDILRKAVDLAAKAIEKHHKNPFLHNIKFDLNANDLTLTAAGSEMEIAVQVVLDKDACLQEGQITIFAEDLHDICKSLPKNTPTEIQTLDDARCLLRSGKGKYTIATLPAKDYPSVRPPSDAYDAIGVRRGELRKLLGRVRFCAAVQDVRYYLESVLLHTKGDTLTLVATDGHRLACATHPLSQEHPERQLILPNKAATELENLLGDAEKTAENDEIVDLIVDDTHFQARINIGRPDENGVAGDELVAVLTTRLIDGKFPDYRRVIPRPEQLTCCAVFDKAAMTDALRRSSVFNLGTLFEFGDNGVLIKSSDNEGGEAIESVETRYEGDPIELSINASYLRSVLAVLEGNICLRMSHPTSPTLLAQEGDDSCQYVVMPMRL